MFSIFVALWGFLGYAKFCADVNETPDLNNYMVMPTLNWQPAESHLTADE